MAASQFNKTKQFTDRLLHWRYGHVRHHEKHTLPYGSLIATSLAVNILSLMLPIMTMHTYNRIIPHKSFDTLTVLILLVFAALILESILRYTRAFVMSWSGAVFEHKAYMDSISHLVNCNQAALESKGPGILVLYATSITRLKDFYGGQALILLTEIPFIIFYLLVILWLGKALVLVPIVIYLGFTLAIWQETSIMLEENRYRDAINAKRTNFIMELLRQVQSVKLLGIEKYMIRRYERLSHQIAKISYILANKSIKSINMIMAGSQLMTTAITTVGSILVINGYIGMGALAACILLSGRMMQPIQRSITLLHRLNEFQLAIEKVDKIFDIPLSHHGTTLPSNGHIRLDMVGYTPPDKDTTIFKNLSLDIKDGEMISILNSRTSGKSTLLSLIAGFTKPSEGSIRIDNLPPELIDPELLHKSVGLIKTQNVIFNGTIMENLTFFDKEKESVAVEYSKLTGLNDIIEKLPLGYETQLYDIVSDPISPGVKQRISILRILINKPKILLIDNADTNLDTEGLDLIIKLILSHKGLQTIIAVTNDQRLLKASDRVYTINNNTLELAEIDS